MAIVDISQELLINRLGDGLFVIVGRFHKRNVPLVRYGHRGTILALSRFGSTLLPLAGSKSKGIADEK